MKLRDCNVATAPVQGRMRRQRSIRFVHRLGDDHSHRSALCGASALSALRFPIDIFGSFAGNVRRRRVSESVGEQVSLHSVGGRSRLVNGQRKEMLIESGVEVGTSTVQMG